MTVERASHQGTTAIAPAAEGASAAGAQRAGKVPIASQIAEVQRELALRRNVYPIRVRERKMRDSEAELCLRRMQAVLETLLFCQRPEADIRAYITARQDIET